ncbi:hypothetical protein [Desertivirga brevis]|uniref:hypothetical protein n=1 Tax=Desertivirga brevis TaxID=2810310 RepID=UPI001A96E278|nr:hypothetical protein [Pedobacter sp. SYSU D00873]
MNTVIKESTTKCISDFNKGYEKGYHSKDYTWEDGIRYTSASWQAESEEFVKGFAKGQQDRLRDEVQKWMC